MKFGKVTDSGIIDFTLPPDHSGTADVLAAHLEKRTGKTRIYVGCAKWNKNDLQNFYPKGVKDELAYYSRQFNCIELNATFYRQFPPEQFKNWAVKTPVHFRFFPKLTREISHIRRLSGVERAVDIYVHAVSQLGEKLGMTFLQLHENFGPENFSRLEKFICCWPEYIPLAVECRNSMWYNNEKTAGQLCRMFEEKKVTNIITDTAGRRDLIHMRLTSPFAFVRYVGTNRQTDYQRLDDWVERIERWAISGIKEIYFLGIIA